MRIKYPFLLDSKKKARSIDRSIIDSKSKT